MRISRLVVRVFWAVLILAVLPHPVNAATQEGSTLLTITNVSATSITTSSATIFWKTNGNATSQVFYDTSRHDNITDYRYYTGLNISLVSTHSIALTGLASATTYHYKVRSAITGTEFIAISGDYTFTTLTPPEVVGVIPPPPLVTTISVPGFTATVPLQVNAQGIVQATTQLTTADGKASLNIVQGTRLLDAQGNPLTALSAAVMPSPPAPPQDAYVIGLAYAFGPAAATFSPPITLTWSYDPNTLSTGVAEEDLVIAYYDATTGAWVELPGVVDTANNRITTSVSHFTTFAIIGRAAPAPPPPAPAPAAFSLSNLTVQPAEVQPKGLVTISVTVANTGGTEGSYTVVLKINGVKEAEKGVTVAAGARKIVTFSVRKDEAGSYSVTVDGLSGNFTVVAPPTPAPPAPAAFSLSNLTVQPTEVQPKEAVTISVTVANTGGTEGSYTVVLKLNGVKEAEKGVTVAAGARKIVTFSVRKDEAGSYSVTVDGLSASFTVVAPASPPPAPPVITTISIPGFTATVPLQVNAQGIVQATTQLTTADGKVSLNIPAGTTILDAQGNPLTSISAALEPAPPAPPPEAAIILAYDLGPDGATFDPPITLTFTYDPSLIPEVVNEENLVIAYYHKDAGKWVELDSVVDTKAKTILAKVSHFTAFAVFGFPPVVPPVVPPVIPPVPPAAFTVSHLSLSPSEVYTGERVTISVIVSNIGGEAGSYEVTLKIDGMVETTKEVTVNAGFAKEVTFTTTRDIAGTYLVDVDGISSSFTVKEKPVIPVIPPVIPEIPPVIAKPVNWPLIGGIIAVVVVVALLVFFLLRRRAT